MTRQEAQKLITDSQYLIDKQIPFKDFNKTTEKNIEVFYRVVEFKLQCNAESSQKNGCTVIVELKRNETNIISIALKTIAEQFPPSYFDKH